MAQINESRSPKMREIVSIKLIISPSKVSPKSQMFYVPDDDRSVWLPLSQITINDIPNDPNKNMKLVDMPRWLCEDQELQDDVE